MTSIRVRRGSQSQYATLRDNDGRDNTRDTAGRQRSRTLTSIFQRPNLQSEEGGGNVRPQLPRTIRPAASADGVQDQNRLTGKVADSIMKSTLRLTAPRSRANRPSLGSSGRASSPNRGHVGMLALEGSQADIIIPTEERPGMIESALSVHSDMSSHSLWRDEDHHEHDIVEALDAIDPQIATISNLANAANSILIPPIPGVYSRKPVVFLPRQAALERRTEDVEKGKGMHEDDLDRHVEEVLGKRAKFKRTMHGVWSFLKTPQGVITAIYGFLCAFWGAAIVIFLAKIINLHNANTQGFWVEVSSQIENALFTVTGIGLIPWRVIDTYRMYRIWSFKRLTRQLRKQAGLPELYDEDDLPDPMYDPNYVHVLDDEQQNELHYQQQQFMKSQTWYRPHGTETHRAFPINTALLICCLIDGNSIFQCFLCGTMWGLNRFQRPAYSTGILIPASFLCGIGAAVFIWRGGQMTKRTKEVEERLRLALALENNQGTSSTTPSDLSIPPQSLEHRSSPQIAKTPKDRDSVFIEEKMDIPPSVVVD